MIKVNELRIGNYVYDHDLELCKIVSLHENGRIRVELPNVEDVPLGSFNVNFAKGIPLTEDILLKCGFNFEELGFNDLSVSYGLTSKNIHFVIDRYYKKIEHLHQLQNLYFALTGEELNVKL